jgi:hypothetical protein
MPSTAPTSPLYSKVTEELKLPLPLSQAVVLCRQAAEGAKGMHIKESEDDRLLVKYTHAGKNSKIEVLLSDADRATTTVILKGWMFGMGKSQLRKAVQELHAAIDERAKHNGASPEGS